LDIELLSFVDVAKIVFGLFTIAVIIIWMVYWRTRR